MAKLNARRWAGGISFVSLGVRLGVRTDDAAMLDCLPLYLPPTRESATTPEVDHLFSLCIGDSGEWRCSPRLYEGPRLVRRFRDQDAAVKLDLLRSLLECRVVASAPLWVFVHAGVVEWRGQAILLPGRSRSGKTTLVAALLRAGAKYYSDELAVLDAAGRVYPWARPLRMRSPERPPQSLPAECFGERAGQSSLPVGLIVVATHRPGARWQPRVLSRGQAVLALMRHTQAVRSRPDVTIAVLGRTVRGARAVASFRDEADTVAARVLSMLSDETGAQPSGDSTLGRDRR